TRFQMPDRCNGTRGNRGSEGRRENEPRCVGADRVADDPRSGYVPAHDAETLGEGTVDDVDAVHDAIALGDAAATRAIEADSVHFVEIGQGIVFFGEIADG